MNLWAAPAIKDKVQSLRQVTITCSLVTSLPVMVKLASATAANLAFVRQQPLTAVFVGATNGIGEYTMRALCKTHGHDGPGLRIILLGRNTTAAQRIKIECMAVCPNAVFHFIAAGDISLLRNVDKACKQVQMVLEESNDTPRVDMLVMCQGEVNFGGRIGQFNAVWVRAV